MALNVTTAVIGSGCNAATASPSLAQWDKGQILQISGVELPDTYKVEFSNADTLEAIPAIGTAEGVEIPDKLLYSSSPIRAYIVLSEAEGERNTEYWVTIYVKPREIPEDIEPTPAQQDVIDDLIAQMNTGVGKADAAADAAEASAGEAEAASQAVQDLGVRAETAASGAPAAVQKIVDAETGAVTLVFFLPQGEAGFSPVVTVTTITGGHRVTVTDADGAHSFDVMDGRSVTGVTMGADYKLTFTFSDGTTWTTPTSIRGETGATPRLTIGTVSTLDPGQGATAEITGTPEDPVLNFGIPKGQAGASDAGGVTYDPTETYQSGTAGAALNDLSRQLSDVESSLNASTGIVQIPLYAANRYIDLSGTSVVMVDGVPQLTTGPTAYSVSMMQCSAGDVFTINGVGGSTPRLWGFVSSAGSILTRSAAGATATNAIITAPTNAAWIITHTNNGAKSYFGKLLPIKIGEIDTEISAINTTNDYLNWESGNIGAADGINYTNTTRARTSNYIKYNSDHVITIEAGIKYSLRYYKADGTFIGSSPAWRTTGNTIANILALDNRPTINLYSYRIVIAYTDDSAISFPRVIGKSFAITAKGNLNDVYSAIRGNISGIDINSTGRGNCSIRCAKEQSYTDGSHSVIEWYLLEEPNTGRFYYSKDLTEKKYLFTFPYDAYKYSFGVLQNGDIIAVFDADSITTDNKDDANRVNPYVFLASENWAICHEVDFGTALKPCGWLGNSGFKVIANGDVLFCEYTRQTTYTCNVWKLSGDPLNASNWVVTKSFVVTSTDNATLFKHAHMVMQDFYTGVCYMSTGDDLIGAMMWASTDNGATWTQLVSPDSDGQVNQYGYINGSEKYCRCLTMTFTKDYIYWATDSSSAILHWLFRAQRDTNGVLDYSTVEDWVNIPENNGASTYGTAYVPELNAIVLFDRCDVIATEMDVKMVTLADGQLHTIGKMESASGSRAVGFRTRFSEWYPKNGLIHFGFALHIGRLTNAVNQNKGFNNVGSGDKPENNINNLTMRVFKVGDGYGMTLDTCFV